MPLKEKGRADVGAEMSSTFSALGLINKLLMVGIQIGGRLTAVRSWDSALRIA